MRRGDVVLYTFRPPDKTRPVVILSRNTVIPVLDTVMVAPVTSTIREIPSEIVIGTAEGLDHDSAVNLDHVQTVAKAQLGRRLGRLSPTQLRALCTALAIAVGCDD